MHCLRDIAPQHEAVCDYDRSHLLIYAELIDADDAGTDWAEGAVLILGIDPAVDREAARTCWESHLARARWITGVGMAAAIEAFGRSDLLAS